MKLRMHAITLLIAASMLLAVQEERIIDLTQPVSRTSPLRFPGVSYGTSSGGRLGPKDYSIPIRIRVVQARFDEQTHRLLVEVSLQNSGDVALTIPASLDGDVNRDGHRERRLLVLRLHIKSDENTTLSQVAGVTFGSISVADSLRKVLPGQDLRFRLALPMPAVDEIPQGKSSNPISLQVGCSEWLASDESYIIVAQAKEVISQAVPVDR